MQYPGLKGFLKSITIADKILFVSLLLVSVLGIFFIKGVLPKGKTVLIKVGDRPMYSLPIDRDKTVSVEGPEGKTVIEIKDHKVRILDSPCPNKLCIKQGWVENGAIICVPNRVTVMIGDYDDEPHKIVDAITG
jgi:hypothetical protein